jgi:DNA-binding NtrC family response regulator
MQTAKPAPYALEKLVGRSPAFLACTSQLPAISASDASVLIEGETGTGKELVARAIHYLSKRAAFPFIALNCGSLPDTLIEAELFGHERGAFTDAHSPRQGLIAQAEGGTLFLDEIDTLPPKAQVGILRLVQDKCYRALGSATERQAHIRILAATNTSLLTLAETGVFRIDLYYRLCVFSIHLPPLRERADDIPLLAQHFLRKHLPADRPLMLLSEAGQTELVRCEWRGNVRELENAIIRGIHLCSGTIIKPSDLRLPTRTSEPASTLNLDHAKLQDFRSMKRSVVESFERDYLARLMSEHRGNISAAARAARKERRDLGRLLKKYDFNATDFQERT